MADLDKYLRRDMPNYSLSTRLYNLINFLSNKGRGTRWHLTDKGRKDLKEKFGIEM